MSVPPLTLLSHPLLSWIPSHVYHIGTFAISEPPESFVTQPVLSASSLETILCHTQIQLSMTSL